MPLSGYIKKNIARVRRSFQCCEKTAFKSLSRPPWEVSLKTLGEPELNRNVLDRTVFTPALFKASISEKAMSLWSSSLNSISLYCGLSARNFLPSWPFRYKASRRLFGASSNSATFPYPRRFRIDRDSPDCCSNLEDFSYRIHSKPLYRC